MTVIAINADMYDEYDDEEDYDEEYDYDEYDANDNGQSFVEYNPNDKTQITSNPDLILQQILEVTGKRYTADAIRDALKKNQNNMDKTLDYLYSIKGMPFAVG
jgi:hypothetical protein